jgi:ferredoxin
MEIDVRRHVWLGEPVHDSHCLTCGECVERCPRGLLRFQPIDAVVLIGQGSQAAAERELAKAART